MSVIVFAILRLVPGDPARVMLGLHATPSKIRAVRAQLGLDRPLPVQYWHWLRGLFHGNLGQDYVSEAPVAQEIAARIPVTVELTLLSTLVAVCVGLPMGALAGAGRRGLGRIADALAVAGITIPDFWLGLMLILVFAGELTLLPPFGWTPLTQDPIRNLEDILLPVATLGFGQAAYIVRTSRGAMEEALKAPSVLLLRAKGLSERSIVFKHALRNAAAPIVTVIGIQFGISLGGAIVIETLYALPGVGQLVVSSISARNYTVVQGCILAIATMFILVNLVADLLVAWLNPRAAEGRQG